MSPAAAASESLPLASPAAARVLLVTADPDLEAKLSAALASTDEARRLSLRRADDLASARESLGAEAADVVLLPLPRRDQRGVLPLVELQAAMPRVPIVVLTCATDESLAIKAVHLGATDYLLAERLHGTLLVRCLLHAVETERVRQRLTEADTVPFAGEQSVETQAASLRVALPQSFDELVDEYQQILDHAVAQLLYRVDHQLEPRIRHLARRAGELRAGPRDIVEIHTTALKARQQQPGSRRAKPYVAEGRVRLVELMGHLATYYRDVSIAALRRASR